MSPPKPVGVPEWRLSKLLTIASMTLWAYVLERLPEDPSDSPETASQHPDVVLVVSLTAVLLLEL